MKVISSFILLLTAVTVFASDSPPVETHQVLYLADAGVVVLRLSVVVEGEGPKQCQEKFVDSLLKSLDKNGDGVVTVEKARGRIPTPREAQQLLLESAMELETRYATLVESVPSVLTPSHFLLESM